MKSGFLLLILLTSLLLATGFARAGDVSCQVDLLKPKFNASVIAEEANKPAKLTVTETKLRLKQNLKKLDSEDQRENNNQETVQVENKKEADKSVKKSSRLGGIFDILLPSKLRNPVK